MQMLTPDALRTRSRVEARAVRRIRRLPAHGRSRALILPRAAADRRVKARVTALAVPSSSV